MHKAEWVFQIHGDERGIPRKLAQGIAARVFPGRHAMLSVVQLEPHSEGAMHSHPEEQWGVLLEGRCVRIQGGEEVEVVPGDFWCTPGGVSHTIRTGDVGALVLDIFSPPREDYRKAGEGFGTAGR